MKCNRLLNILRDSLEPKEFVEVLQGLMRIGVELKQNDQTLWSLKSTDHPRLFNMTAEESPYFELVYPNGTTKVVPAREGESVCLEGATECNYTDDAILLTIGEDTEAYGTLEDVIEAIGASL